MPSKVIPSQLFVTVRQTDKQTDVRPFKNDFRENLAIGKKQFLANIYFPVFPHRYSTPLLPSGTHGTSLER